MMVHRVHARNFLTKSVDSGFRGTGGDHTGPHLRSFPRKPSTLRTPASAVAQGTGASSSRIQFRLVHGASRSRRPRINELAVVPYTRDSPDLTEHECACPDPVRASAVLSRGQDRGRFDATRSPDVFAPPRARSFPGPGPRSEPTSDTGHFLTTCRRRLASDWRTATVQGSSWA